MNCENTETGRKIRTYNYRKRNSYRDRSTKAKRLLCSRGKERRNCIWRCCNDYNWGNWFWRKEYQKALEVTLSAATGAFTSAVFKSYSSQLASKFDMITNDNPTKCTMVYQYKRVGSNDGFYWLKDIKIK